MHHFKACPNQVRTDSVIASSPSATACLNPVLTALLLGLLLVANAAVGEPTQLKLAKEQQDLAKKLTLRVLSEKKLLDKRTYFVQAELVRRKKVSTQAGHHTVVQVTFYRYDGDLAILTLVDLTAQEVLQVRTEPHLPVPLSEEEFRIARELALRDPEVRKALGPLVSKVEVGAHVVRPVPEPHQFLERRAVRLLFKLGADYLSEPVVVVDLVGEKVVIEEKHP